MDVAGNWDSGVLCGARHRRRGVVYYTFHSLTAVFIYEVILLLGAGAFVSR